MAANLDLATRMEAALKGLLAALFPGVEVREFNDDEDDGRKQVAIKVEKESEEIPGAGIWLLNCMIRLRNLAASQILIAENYFRDSETVRASLATAGAGEFLLPTGNGTVALRGNWTRTGEGSNKIQNLSFDVTAQAYEVGTAP